MTSRKSLEELNNQYSREMVNQSLSVWSALNRACQVSVRRLKVTLLTSMTESDIATDRKDFEQLAMIAEQFAREEVARAKGLVAAAKYHDIVASEERCRRILIGLSPYMHFTPGGFALRIGVLLLHWSTP